MWLIVALSCLHLHVVTSLRGLISAIVDAQAHSGLGFFLSVGSFTELLDPALMGLLATVTDKAGLGVEPFCALDAVVAAQVGKVLFGFGVLVLGEVFRRQKIGLDLIDVPGFSPRLDKSALIADTHLESCVCGKVKRLSDGMLVKLFLLLDVTSK